MAKARVVFMGTPYFAVPSLRKINENFIVELIVTQPDRVNRRGKIVDFNPVKKFALENNLPICQPENVNNLASVKIIEDIKPDYIVVVAFGQIIGKDLLIIPKKNIVNVHASILPKYRGAAPIHRAIMEGEKITGVSIMKVGPGLDKGEVYLVDRTEVCKKKLPELHDELASMGANLLVDYIKQDMVNRIYGTEQDDSIATYAHKVSKEDGFFDYIDIDLEIGKVNGLYPRPGASINYLGQRVKILDAEIISRHTKTSENLGQIIKVDDKGIYVNCGNGILLIKEIQFPGKKVVSVKEYLKGNEIQITKLR